ncbi:MAG: hypothetical protein K8R17_11650 [Methanosarcinales archaeon]|nr:hypothetical protein [Methanosarcinales archaeon]
MSTLKILLPILGLLAAIVAYELFGVWAMIVIAWIALILFILGGKGQLKE